MRREQATLERQSDVRRDAVVKMAREAIAAERDAFVAEVEVEVMDHARDYVRREMRSLESAIRASLTSTVRARLRDHAAAAAAAAADVHSSSLSSLEFTRVHSQFLRLFLFITIYLFCFPTEL